MWQKRKYRPYIRPTHQYQLATLYFSFKRCAFAFPGLCLNEFPIHQSYNSLKQDVYQGRYINNCSFKMHVLIDMSNQFYNSLWISNCHKYNCFKKKFSKVFYRIYLGLPVIWSELVKFLIQPEMYFRCLECGYGFHWYDPLIISAEHQVWLGQISDLPGCKTNSCKSKKVIMAKVQAF